MFLNNFTIEQKKAFLAIAMRIIGADGFLDPRERQMIESMRYEMGLFTETDLPGKYTGIEELAKPFDSRKSQVILMLESIALAYADDEFASEEAKILRELALIFNFSEEEATAMENWVQKYRGLIKEAVEMFSN
jgi:tellurite resistance protein